MNYIQLNCHCSRFRFVLNWFNGRERDEKWIRACMCQGRIKHKSLIVVSSISIQLWIVSIFFSTQIALHTNKFTRTTRKTARKKIGKCFFFSFPVFIYFFFFVFWIFANGTEQKKTQHKIVWFLNVKCVIVVVIVIILRWLGDVFVYRFRANIYFTKSAYNLI